MHAVYAADIMSRKPGVHPGCVVRLKQLCIDAICRHVGDMEVQTLLELPTPLIKELIPHLNIIDLERLQPALNNRGISTYLAWVTILQDVWGPHYAVDIHSEEQCKEEAMDKLFRLVFYGFKNKGIIKHFPSADISSLFLVMAKYLKCFHVRPARWLCSLATEQKALLGVLERTVRRVEVKQPLNASKRLSKYVLYVLHRLLDHGAATELALHNQEPAVVQWILTARGNKLHIICTAAGGESGPEPEQPQETENVVPRKRSRLSAQKTPHPPHHHHHHPHHHRTDKERQQTPPSSPPPGGSGGGGVKTSCPRGNIRSLQVTECGHGVIDVLSPLLPTWLCLRSLSLHGLSIPNSSELSTLASCLGQLCGARGSVLSELSVGLVTDAAFVSTLLEACPTLTALSVELHPMTTPTTPTQPHPHPPPPHARPRRRCTSRGRCDTELRLERLSVKVSSVETDVGVVTSVLKRCPHLTSLHVRGLRPTAGSSHRQLLVCITESNRRLRNLHLEDVNLDDCLPDLLTVLTTCPMEELKLRDCRLLDKFSGRKNKEKALRQLVECVKRTSSLHSLSLCQNRLAKNVSTLAELFNGAPQSSVTALDISSTSIQAADLMDLARGLEQSPPARRVTLDLRRNPWDRNHRQWNVALGVLHAHCDFLMDSYRSTPDMMAVTCRPGVFD